MAVRQRSPLLRLYMSLSGAVILLSTGLTVFLLMSIKEGRIREQKAELAAANSIFSEHIQRVFTSINWMAFSAANAYTQAKQDRLAVSKQLARINAEEAYSLQVSVVDMDGIFQVSNVSSAGGTDLRDRDHIRVHLSDNSPDIYVSKPLVGRVSGKPSVNVTKRFLGPDGKPSGIIVVSYDPLKLNSYFDRHDLRGDGIIALFRSDGILLARSGTPAEKIGLNLADSPVFKNINSKGSREGTLEVVSRIDGVRRIINYRSLDFLPLVVVTGAAADSVARDLLPLQALGFVWAAIFLASLVMGGYFLIKFEREQLEAQALQESERKANNLASLLQSAFKATGILVVIFDRRQPSQVFFANETAIQLLDFGNSESSGKSRVIEELRSAESRGDGNFNQRVRGVVDGIVFERSFFWTLARAEWVSPDAGIAIGFDRTEVESAERSLYQQSRLTSLGELVTGLSHELAQPLTVISFASSMIAKSANGEVEEFIDLLARATENVSRTVERMKVFGRRNPNASAGAFSLTDCVEAVVMLTRNELKLSEIGLTVEGLSEDTWIKGDKILFEQVVLNLVLNARDAMAQGCAVGAPKELKISFGQDTGENAWVRVADTGPGIPDSVVGRIFEPFFTTKSNGSGLGLSLSYGIVREMGGHISVSSTTSETTFEVVVPIV